jgi:hypothetical protein
LKSPGEKTNYPENTRTSPFCLKNRQCNSLKYKENDIIYCFLICQGLEGKKQQISDKSDQNKAGGWFSSRGG